MPGLVAIKVTVQPGRLEIDKKGRRRALMAAGQEIAAATRAMLRSSAGGGRLYHKPGGGTYRASAPGQPPARRTGALASSVRVRTNRDGDRVIIRAGQFYDLFLEVGARGGGGARGSNIRKAGETKFVRGRVVIMRGANRMAVVSQTRVLLPRPALSVVLAQKQASISGRLADAINDSIKFVRVR